MQIASLTDLFLLFSKRHHLLFLELSLKLLSEGSLVLDVRNLPFAGLLNCFLLLYFLPSRVELTVLIGIFPWNRFGIYF